MSWQITQTRWRSNQPKRAFFHLNEDINCNITGETCLHEGSKLFLKECLEDSIEPKIYFPVVNLPNSALKSILQVAGINKFQIQMIDLLGINMLVTNLESKIDGSDYIGDLVSRYPSGDKIAMVWEIFVSHEIESDKRKWLDDNCIPYIELIPLEYSYDEFAFEVKTFNNIEKLNINNFSLFNLQNIFYDELSIMKKDNLKEFFSDIARKLKLQPVEIRDTYWFDNFLKNGIKKFREQNKHIIIEQEHYNDITLKEALYYRNELLEKIDVRRSDYGEYLIFNKNKSAESFLNLSGEFFKKLGKSIGLMGYLNNNNELFGIYCDFLNEKMLEKSIRIPEDAYLKCGKIANKYDLVMLNLAYIHFNPGNIRFEYDNTDIEGVKSEEPGYRSYFSAPAELLKLTLMQLQKNEARIELILRSNEPNGKEYVTGFKISGLYNKINFQNFIADLGSKMAQEWIHDFWSQIQQSIDYSAI